MRMSIQLFSVFGIPVKLHWTFGLVFIFLIYLSWSRELETVQVVWMTLAAIALFVSIIFHEYGHALAAKRFGVATHDILLLPIGGLARLERLPERPLQEFWVALAGPGVNIAIALLLLPYLLWVTAPAVADMGEIAPERILSDPVFFPPYLFALNLGLAVFNLLPAFPMDGGRVLRALLSIRFGHYRATQIAAWIGHALAVSMMVWGVWSGRYTYVPIGLFIIVAALREKFWAWREHQLTHSCTRDFMSTSFITVSKGISTQEILRLLEERNAAYCVATDNGTVSGIAEKEELVKCSAYEDLPEWERPALELSPETTLKEAVGGEHLEQSNPLLPVVEHNEVIGVLSLGEIEKWIENKASLY